MAPVYSHMYGHMGATHYSGMMVGNYPPAATYGAYGMPPPAAGAYGYGSTPSPASYGALPAGGAGYGAGGGYQGHASGGAYGGRAPPAAAYGQGECLTSLCLFVGRLTNLLVCGVGD